MKKNKLTKYKRSRFLPSMAALALIGTGALVYAGTASASTGAPYVISASSTAQTRTPGERGNKKGSGVSGTVTAVNGDSITLTGKNSTTYTVDATNAKISKIAAVASGTASTTRPTPTTITVSQIAVGDTLMVRGTVSGTSVAATAIIDGNFSGGRGTWAAGSSGSAKAPGVSGTVTAVNGDSITLTGKNSTTYTIDATNAKISKITPPAAGTTGTTTRPTPTAITVSQISVGDTLMVQGTVSGTSVTATNIIDGKFGGFGGRGGKGSPRIGGTVTAVSGDSITVTDTPKTGTPTVYTVDVSSAKITERGAKGTAPATVTASDIIVGDKVAVRGTVSGTSVTATAITLMSATTTAASTQ